MTQNAWNSPSLDANGEILMGSAGAIPTAGQITGDSNVTITPGANTITVASTATAGALTKISTATASTSASIDFTDLSSTYFLYMLRFNDVLPATDSSMLILRTSTDNGSSYDSGASDYSWAMFYVNQIGDEYGLVDQADTFMRLIGDNGTNDMGNGANETASGTVWIYNPSAVKYTFINSEAYFFNQDTENTAVYTAGRRESAADVDAVQISINTGNITSGTFTLYGVSNA